MFHIKQTRRRDRGREMNTITIVLIPKPKVRQTVKFLGSGDEQHRPEDNGNKGHGVTRFVKKPGQLYCSRAFVPSASCVRNNFECIK